MKVKNDEELQAWDAYLAASLELAKTGVVGSNTNEYLEKVIKHAAELADKMLVERRKRV